MTSNNKKSATLGMPHGTATGRLRKMVLFHLLKKHSENICVRCNKEIENVDDLSLEHIKPWEGISADLFWDLNNISFSHIFCNRPHRLHGNKKFTSEGTAWCSGHQAELSIEEFQKCARKDDGLQPYCKACRTRIDTRVNHAKK